MDIVLHLHRHTAKINKQTNNNNEYKNEYKLQMLESIEMAESAERA